LLAERRGFTALVAYNAVMAQGALIPLAESALRVPVDVSVAGYVDTLARFPRPKLSTVAIPKERMGRLAASMLIERINGYTGKPRNILLRPEPVIREPVGPPRWQSKVTSYRRNQMPP